MDGSRWQGFYLSSLQLLVGAAIYRPVGAAFHMPLATMPFARLGSQSKADSSPCPKTSGWLWQSAYVDGNLSKLTSRFEAIQGGMNVRKVVGTIDDRFDLVMVDKLQQIMELAKGSQC